MKWPKISLKKVHFEGDGEYFLLTKIEDNEKEFPDAILELTNGSQSFRGSISSKDMKDHLRKLRLEKDAFIKMTVNALTNIQTEDDLVDFSYTIKKESSEQWVMMWKKYIPAEDIKIQLGSMTLQTVPCADMTSTILDSAAYQLMTLEKQVNSLEKERVSLQQEKEQLVTTLRDKVYEKSELENKLMTKFVLVLNAKKTKIGELKTELQSCKERHANGTKDEELDLEEQETVQSTTIISRKNSSPDSSLRLSQDEINVPTTSRRSRRVRTAKNLQISTPPAAKKRFSLKRNDTQNSEKNLDLECDTLELMDDM